MEEFEFNEHNLWLYLHGDPTEEMTLSGVEYHFIPGDEQSRRSSDRYDQLLVFVPMSWIEDFAKFLPDGTFDDGALKAHLNGNSIVIDIIDICNNYDIDYKKLLTADERKQYFGESS